MDSGTLKLKEVLDRLQCLILIAPWHIGAWLWQTAIMSNERKNSLIQQKNIARMQVNAKNFGSTLKSIIGLIQKRTKRTADGKWYATLKLSFLIFLMILRQKHFSQFGYGKALIRDSPSVVT